MNILLVTRNMVHQNYGDREDNVRLFLLMYSTLGESARSHELMNQENNSALI